MLTHYWETLTLDYFMVDAAVAWSVQKHEYHGNISVFFSSRPSLYQQPFRLFSQQLFPRHVHSPRVKLRP